MFAVTTRPVGVNPGADDVQRICFLNAEKAVAYFDQSIWAHGTWNFQRDTTQLVPIPGTLLKVLLRSKAPGQRSLVIEVRTDLSFRPNTSDLFDGDR